MQKIRIGILGATGMVGQNYIRLLVNHPYFEVSCLAASPRSAGMKYKDAVKGRWYMDIPIPENVKDLDVLSVEDVDAVSSRCQLVFSAFEIDSKDKIRELENNYAGKGIAVCSNSSAHRYTEDVPMIVGEINADHLKMIQVQRRNRSWDKGLILVKPNCSLQSYIIPVHAIMCAGYKIEKIILTTLQALSGAGFPGVSGMDAIDNVVPFIGGEEEKTEKEPMKILGSIENDKFVSRDDLIISATCNRVSVIDGHLACVSLLFGEKKPSKEEILSIWQNFKAEPQELDLPFAPKQPIIYNPEDNRPQPRKDRNNDKGMAVTVGRLRECNVFDYKFTALSHNTIRGAAGGGILNAELLVKKGYIN